MATVAGTIIKMASVQISKSITGYIALNLCWRSPPIELTV